MERYERRRTRIGTDLGNLEDISAARKCTGGKNVKHRGGSLRRVSTTTGEGNPSQLTMYEEAREKQEANNSEDN